MIKQQNNQLNNNKNSGIIQKMKKILKSKRGQEEMIGFILIIILVGVIALVFIFISLRKPAEARPSSEISEFLYSSLAYTTNCQPSAERYNNFQDLIKACGDGEKCLSGEDSCEILRNVSIALIDAGFQVSPDSRYKAYEFSIYAGNASGNQSLLYLKHGNFTTNLVGSDAFFISRETYHLKLKLSY